MKHQKGDHRGTALITGASSGIGAEYSRQLAAHHYDLILVARRKKKLEELADVLRKTYGIVVKILAADLSRERDIKKVEQAITRCRDLTVLINNAGFGTLGEFADVKLNASTEMLTVHNTATVRLTYAVLQQMRKHGFGRIINIASVAAFMTPPRGIMYSATKMFLVSFSKGLQYEEWKNGISIQAVCPGTTHTEFHSAGYYKKYNKKGSSIPGWAWLNVQKVVKESLQKAHRRKVIIVPGIVYKLVVPLIRAPFIGPLLLSMMYSVYKKEHTGRSSER